MAVVGRVEQLLVHPVKSMAATPLERVEVTSAGLAGDRGRVVVDAATGERLREKTAPGLAAIDPTGDDAAARVSAALGRTVRIEDAGAPQVMVAAVHLVSRQALERAAAGDVPAGCSAHDPRANVRLDLPEDDERDWVGRELVLGGTRLLVTRLPRHCLGVYADVVTPGPVGVGDPVELG
ncbi:sulfurase [Geodermatophilaceae bacterium NBWT11]|nr:sulfurase [Geodermatophilaceae bacterium NBWT11]